MSALDGLFGSAAKAFEPVVKRQIDALWPKIDQKVDQIIPQVLAAVVPAIVKVLEAQVPHITDRIVDKLMEHLPQIIEGAIRAVVPDVLENAFPVNKLADEITNRIRGLLGGLGGIIPGFGR